MPETLRDALEDIRPRLNAGVYQNEEHVRLSLRSIHLETMPH